MSLSEKKPQIKRELTPLVMANNKDEYRQFEIAYKKGAGKQKRRASSQDKKSSFKPVKVVSRRVKNDRMIKVYSNGLASLP